MRNTDSADRLRRFLRAERKRRGWTQLDLAHRAGIAKNTVAALEGGMALREGNEGAVEEALGLALGTLEDVRRGRYAPADADQAVGETPTPPMPQAADYSSEYELMLAIYQYLTAEKGMSHDAVIAGFQMAAAALRNRSESDGKEVG